MDAVLIRAAIRFMNPLGTTKCPGYTLGGNPPSVRRMNAMRGIKGELYICDKDVFDQTYEQA